MPLGFKYFAFFLAFQYWNSVPKMKIFKYFEDNLVSMEISDMFENLMDSKVTSIIKLFLKNENNQFYLREISKATGVSLASTFRILNKLVKMGILRIDEIKTAKLYTLNPGKLTESLKSILEADSLQIFVEKLANVPSVEEVLLLSKDKSKANLLILGASVDTSEVKRICVEIKEKYSFTLNQMSLTREQYEQMSTMGLYPGMKKTIYAKKSQA